EHEKIKANPGERPRWPMIVLRTPKGWTGPHAATPASHQVPLTRFPEQLEELETWMRSYRPEELFDEQGRPLPEVTALAPHGERRMGANPHANGGLLLHDLKLADFRAHAVDVPTPATTTSEATRVLGEWLREVARENPQTF